ncbi:MAG TPA: NUDIX hydrolase [Bryobacteraceae bacterium]|nr:NUDIX hydrolase [Bryobacteraceae bacterium]
MKPRRISRRYPKHPLLGVGALIFRRDSILLVERGRQPLKGYWSLPGGLVETGERLEAAVQREILEETGLRATPVSIFEIFERIMRDDSGQPEYHYVLIDYICKVAGGELRAGDDVSRVEWVRRRSLRERQLTEGTLAVIEKAFHARRNRS